MLNPQDWLSIRFLSNYVICLNESPNSSNLIPPTLEAYIPLDEDVKVAHRINAEILGDAYNYFV